MADDAQMIAMVSHVAVGHIRFAAGMRSIGACIQNPSTTLTEYDATLATQNAAIFRRNGPLDEIQFAKRASAK
jgi:hypothetical protein